LKRPRKDALPREIFTPSPRHQCEYGRNVNCDIIGHGIMPAPMNTHIFRFRRQFLGGLVSFISALAWRGESAQAATDGGTANPSVGNASLVVGNVTLNRDGQQPLALVQDAKLNQGDLVETNHDSELHISFDDGGYLALRPNSALKIDEYVVTGAATDSATLNLLKGALRSITGWIGKLDAPRYRMVATTAVIGVRGTDHEVIIVAPEDAAPGMDAGVHNRVNEGGTTLRNANGVVNIASGSAAFSPRSGTAPRAHVGVPEFFNRRRTQHEAAVVTHAQNIRQHMEQRLRARGKLQPNEHFNDFRKRQQVLREKRVEQRGQLQRGREQPGRPGGAAAHEAQTGREARHEQWKEHLRQREQAAAHERHEKAVREGRARQHKE
jgi:hypothetical protein